MCVLGISSTLSKWDDQCNTLGEVDCLIEGAVSNGGPLALSCVVTVHHPKCRVPQIGEPTKGRGGGGTYVTIYKENAISMNEIIIGAPKSTRKMDTTSIYICQPPSRTKVDVSSLVTDLHHTPSFE